MNKTRILVTLLIAACGSSSKDPATPTAPTAPTEPVAVEPMAEPTGATEPSTASVAGEREASSADAPPPDRAPTAPAMPAAAPTPPAAQLAAVATLRTVSGDRTVGDVTFTLGDAGMLTIEGRFTGLPPGPHAIYVYEGHDCGDKAKRIGPHLNPTHTKHGPPSSGTRHAGDFGDVAVGPEGNATFAIATDSLSMEDGRADTLPGRTIAIHRGADNVKGNAGPVIACGEIKRP